MLIGIPSVPAVRLLSRTALLVTALVLGSCAAPTAGQAEKPAAPAVIRVATDGSGDFTEIQPAIDAAGSGAVVRVGPGTYAGPVRIQKRITLEGAGWKQTAVEVKYDPSGLEDPARVAEFRKRAAAAKTDEERMALRVEFMEKHGPQPVLYLSKADGAVIRGIRFTLTGDTPREGISMFGWVVAIRGGKAILIDCAVVGSPASGIGVGLGADAEIRNCLVAGVWSTGIEVVRMPGDESRARIIACTIRNGHHRCVTLAGVDSTTVVEGCAISGSAWHGIRYDDASPIIRGNRLFGNAFGIYASGDTSATVTGNLFIENESAGMVCFFGGRDTIEKNTFARTGRSGLSVRGVSSPMVRRNIFFANPTAIATGHVSGERAGSQYEGPLTVEGNFFWRNKSVGFFGPEAERPEPDAAPDPQQETARLVKAGNNRVEDPGFVNAEAGNFTLAPGSPARKAGAGAGSVPAAEGPWPLQPAEIAMRAILQVEEDDEAEEESIWEARHKAWTWIEDVMQLGDAARRAKGLAQIEKALAATERSEILAGLVALSAVQQARFDRTKFRTRVQVIAESGPLSFRVAAVNALAALGADAEALELLGPLVNEHPESLDDIGWHTWLRLNKGALTGRPAEYVLSRLKARNSRQVRDLIASLQMARTLAPALEARIIELAIGEDFEMRGSIVHFVLDGLDPKSPAVVKALIGIAENSRMPGGERALYALTTGIGPRTRTLVADFFVRFLATRERDERARSYTLRALARLAEDEQVADLEAILDNPLTSEELRKGVRDLLAHLEKRDAEPDPDQKK